MCCKKFFFSYIFSPFIYIFPTKEGMLHSYQAESSSKVDNPHSDPNPEPNKDVNKGNTENSEDSDSDNNSDSNNVSDSSSGIEKYGYPDIVSVKWPREYFRGNCKFRDTLFNLHGTYTEPHVDQVLLGTIIKDPFASSKKNLDFSQFINRTDFDFLASEQVWTKDEDSYVLINWAKKLAIR